jgi:hypothetical protein
LILQIKFWITPGCKSRGNKVSVKLFFCCGIQYEFSTIFHTEPNTHVNKYVLELRYRKQTSHQWLYYEIVPLVSFDKEYDYKFNPGIRLRLEFFFGKSGARQFWRGEAEDSEEFRW